MTALSIKLPDELAESSRQIARRIGISRSELIRRALVHEIEAVQASLERQAMAQSLRLLAQRPEDLAAAEALDEALSEPLAGEGDEWWNG